MKTVLEESTNTHSTNSNVIVIDSFEKMNTIILNTNGAMIVEHGHHNTVATNPSTKRVIKIIQQEENPITKSFYNVFD